MGGCKGMQGRVDGAQSWHCERCQHVNSWIACAGSSLVLGLGCCTHAFSLSVKCDGAITFQAFRDIAKVDSRVMAALMQAPASALIVVKAQALTIVTC